MSSKRIYNDNVKRIAKTLIINISFLWFRKNFNRNEYKEFKKKWYHINKSDS